MSGAPDPVKDAGAALSAVAQALFEAENGPDLVFVRAQAEAGAAAAGLIVDKLALLWERYPAATDAVERLAHWCSSVEPPFAPADGSNI